MTLFLITGGFLILLSLAGAWFYFPRETASAEISVNNHLFLAEVADTLPTRARGLSGRPALPPDRAMLFIFSSAARHGFWMKGMRFPLDIIWIKDDRVLSVSESLPPARDGQWPVYYPPEPVQLVLEVSGGTAARLGIRAGDPVSVVKK